MARLPRVVIADVPHHVTQRGNARQVILGDDADRSAYIELLRQYCELYRLSLLGLLPDVESCALDRDSPDPRSFVANSQTDPWTVRVLLERAPVVERARVAGTILFVSAG